MRLAGQIIKRTGWSPTEVTIIPIEFEHIDEIYPLLKQLAEDPEVMFFSVDIWNEEKVSALRAQSD